MLQLVRKRPRWAGHIDGVCAMISVEIAVYNERRRIRELKGDRSTGCLTLYIWLDSAIADIYKRGSQLPFSENAIDDVPTDTMIQEPSV